MTETQRPVTFLSLPLELRDRIYGLILIVPSGMIYIEESGSGKLSSTVIGSEIDLCPAPPTDLLRVSRQVYHEALPILYSQNILHFYYPTTLQTWLHKIGPLNIALLQHLNLHVNTLNRENNELYCELFSKLASNATGLHKLRISCLGVWRDKSQRTDFMHALAKIQGLTELKIKGDGVGADWLSYLRDKMGVKVVLVTNPWNRYRF
jgi:hypothetical protein